MGELQSLNQQCAIKLCYRLLCASQSCQLSDAEVTAGWFGTEIDPTALPFMP